LIEKKFYSNRKVIIDRIKQVAAAIVDSTPNVENMGDTDREETKKHANVEAVRRIEETRYSLDNKSLDSLYKKIKQENTARAATTNN
jgi:hypothetical protein